MNSEQWEKFNLWVKDLYKDSAFFAIEGENHLYGFILPAKKEIKLGKFLWEFSAKYCA